MASKQNVLPVAGILSGALVWGLIWYPYRVLQDAGVSGALAILITYVLAMLFGAFMLPGMWRELNPNHSCGTKADGSALAGPPHALRWAVLLVLSTGWANLGYVLAMLQGEVMRVLLLFYLAPVWTILFSYWLLGERLNRYGYMVIALSLGGALVMLWEPQLGMPLPQNLAEWIALSAGMGFAFSNVVSRRAVNLSVATKTYSVWFGSALLTAPLLWWQGGLSNQLLEIDAQIWLTLALLGIALCATSFAVQYGITHMPANRAIPLFLSELVFAAVSSYLLAGEALQLREWLGGALIISASLLSGKLCAQTEES